MNVITELEQQLAPYQGILFDLDNTLFLQTKFDHSAFLEISHCIAEKYQLDQQPLFNFLVKHRSAPPPYKDDLFGCCCREFHLATEEARLMLTLFRQHQPENLALDLQYQQLLTALLQQHKTLLLVTNGIGSIQQTKINKLQLNRYFKEMVICTTAGEIPLKPNPTAFVYLKEKYPCSNWVMVGDLAETDGLFAKNSGIDFIQHQYCGGGL